MGGKNKKSAEASNSEICQQPDNPVPGSGKGVLPCKQHWIGVRVEDEDGKAVKDVICSVELTDGSQLTINFATATLENDGTYRTQKVLPSGDCEFAFPNVQDVEWWPKGGSAAAVPANEREGLRAGDCAVKIADEFGFRNYHSVWDHSRNDNVRGSRKNANILSDDDVLYLPDKKKKTVKKAVDQVWTFVVKKRRPVKLRIVLFDREDKPLNGLAWKLESPVKKNGTTGADGLIEVDEFPPQATEGKLEVTMNFVVKVGKPAQAPAAPLAYPPVIKHADFRDDPDPEPPRLTKANWDLEFGSLPPHDTKEGVQARLYDLGYSCQVKSNEKRTSRSVKAYQRFYKKEKAGTGKPKDIETDLRDRFEKP